MPSAVRLLCLPFPPPARAMARVDPMGAAPAKPTPLGGGPEGAPPNENPARQHPEKNTRLQTSPSPPPAPQQGELLLGEPQLLRVELLLLAHAALHAREVPARHRHRAADEDHVLAAEHGSSGGYGRSRLIGIVETSNREW